MMDNSDTRIFCVDDIWMAFGLLTRLPLPERQWNDTRDASMAAWAYPVVGLILALIAGGTGFVLLALGVPTGVAAAFILGLFTVLTGAMHEDGLADAADGLWGGHVVAQRLAIMKDSHIGAYGVLALVTSFALRWSALTALISAGWLWAPLMAIAPLSRAAMAWVMYALPNARADGLSHMTGRPGRTGTLMAAGIAALCGFAGIGPAALGTLMVAAITAAMCMAIARAKIGGQTGDILGATQQMTEIALLTSLCVVLL